MKRASVYTAEHHLLVSMLRDLRLAARIPQAEAAERLQRPQTYVSAVELGDRGLDLFQVRELVILYGEDFAEFIASFERRLAEGVGPVPERPTRPRRASK